MKKPLLTRRSFLKGAGYGLGAALGTRLVGNGALEGEARAENENPALLCVFLRGGYNALFSAAGGLKGSFGVDDGRIEDRGNSLVIDAETYGTFTEATKAKMANLGVAHGLSDHADSQMQKWWADGTRSYVLTLADALGGEAAIKAAIVGDDTIPGIKKEVNGVSLQTIADMDATIAAMGAAAADERQPERGITAAALERSGAMSKAALDANKTSLVTLQQGYPTVSTLLRKPVKTFSPQKLDTDYGLGGARAVDDWKSRMAAAELMITAGANVVIANSENWDSHGDSGGDQVRNQMRDEILPPLKVFLENMLNDPNRNVVIAIFGDFARSLPDSDHQPNCAVTVIGRNVKPGSTGNVDAGVNMPPNTPDIPGMWAYLAAALKAPTEPFGKNPHPLLR